MSGLPVIPVLSLVYLSCFFWLFPAFLIFMPVGRTGPLKTARIATPVLTQRMISTPKRLRGGNVTTPP